MFLTDTQEAFSFLPVHIFSLAHFLTICNLPPDPAHSPQLPKFPPFLYPTPPFLSPHYPLLPQQAVNKNGVRTHSVTLLFIHLSSSCCSQFLFLLLFLRILRGSLTVPLWFQYGIRLKLTSHFRESEFSSSAKYDKCLVKKNNQAEFKMPRCRYKTTRLNWLLFFLPVCAVQAIPLHRSPFSRSFHLLMNTDSREDISIFAGLCVRVSKFMQTNFTSL